MTIGRKSQQETSGDTDAGLNFPWGRQSIVEIFRSARAEAYLAYVNRQPSLRRLHFLDRLLGLTKHRTKASYPEQLRQYYRAKHKLEGQKWH